MMLYEDIHAIILNVYICINAYYLLQSRPKSANRGKDETPISGKFINTQVTRVTRLEREKLQPALKVW